MKECRELCGESIEDLKTVISEQGLANIPNQICSWMNKNGYKPPTVTPGSFPQKFATNSLNSTEVIFGGKELQSNNSVSN